MVDEDRLVTDVLVHVQFPARLIIVLVLEEVIALGPFRPRLEDVLSTRLLPVEDLLIAQDPQGILLALMVVGHIPLILRIEMKLRMGKPNMKLRKNKVSELLQGVFQDHHLAQDLDP